MELSTLYALRTAIDATWSNVTTVVGFTNAYKAALPVVSVELLDVDNRRKEVGNTTVWSEYTIVINIFASSDPQRLDLSQFILDTLASGWVYNTYAKATATTITGTAAGRAFILRYLIDRKVTLGMDVDKYDLHRHECEFLVRIGTT